MNDPMNIFIRTCIYIIYINIYIILVYGCNLQKIPTTAFLCFSGLVTCTKTSIFTNAVKSHCCWSVYINTFWSFLTNYTIAKVLYYPATSSLCERSPVNTASEPLCCCGWQWLWYWMTNLRLSLPLFLSPQTPLSGSFTNTSLYHLWRSNLNHKETQAKNRI